MALVSAACNLVFPLDGIHAGGDAEVTDSGGGDSGDSDVDAGDGGDWCDSQEAGALLCSDFDQTDAATQGFNMGLVTSGTDASVTLTTTYSVSPPNGALGVTGWFDAGQTANARLEASLWPYGSTHPTLDCQFQWRAVATSPVANDYATVLEIAFWSDNLEKNVISALRIDLQSNGVLVFSENGTSHTIPVTVTNGWMPVDVSLVLSPPATYHVQVNGAAAPGNTLVTAIPAQSHATFEIGPAYFGMNTTAPSPGWQYAYDNVICR